MLHIPALLTLSSLKLNAFVLAALAVLETRQAIDCCQRASYQGGFRRRNWGLSAGMDHSPAELVGTGLFLGLMHVFTPDHLSALSALSVGSSWRAFALGVRWGIGHSSGLLLVTAIFIYLKGDLDLRRFGRYCDGLVGLCMALIGVYGVFGALKHARERRRVKKKEPSLSGDEEMLLTKMINGGDSKIIAPDSSGCVHSRTNGKHSLLKDDSTAAILPLQTGWHPHSHHDDDAKVLAEDCRYCPFIDIRNPITQRIVSFAIGLLHGIAGPGGVLAVFPTVQMTRWQSSSLYLGSFILASTVSMGAFASCYGESTRRLGSSDAIELGLRIFSSFMSVLVGFVWLSLSILGKLDDFFH